MEDTAVQDLAATIKALVRDTNRMWAEGDIAADSTIRQVDPGLEAVQYSPRFADGPWRARSAQEWLDGTLEAARALAGQSCSWSLHDLVILPRSEREAVASYRIVHEWSDGRKPASALFLETWSRSAQGRWNLLRHTAEKV
jgi:hypothetical protein